LAVIPLFGAFLFAQDQVRTETRTTTTKTSLDGTLVDAACQTTRTERKETTRESNPGVTRRTETTHTETIDCPVTTTTTTFGLLTSDGRFVRFDNPSNTRVVEIVRGNQPFNKYIVDRTPFRVKIVGTTNGDVAVVESLNPFDSATVSVRGSAERVDPASADVIFDVRHSGDRGKLFITAKGVNFEDLNDADHSRSWSYSQIKELKREGGNVIKIEPHSGDSFEFRLEGAGMTDAVYRTIGDRIVAARGR
jgi:hypothetical protein